VALAVTGGVMNVARSGTSTEVVMADEEEST